MSDRPPAEPSRIVKPRKPSEESRPVIALTRELCVVESMGEEVFPAENLGEILYTTPSSIIAVQGFALHLQRLQRSYRDDPQFNYRVTPIRRYSRAWDDGRRLTQGMICDTVCNFVGWKAEGRSSGRNPNRYHFPLDPLWFLTSSIDELQDGPDVQVVKLYRWAREVRDWCAENGITAKASAGGIAAQLLRDSRFYPEPRRKVPRNVNSISRYRLPGNYYHLRAEVGRRYRAVYLDMEDAHHAMAKRIKFPSANTLHGYGDMAWSAQEDKRSPKAWAAGTSKVLEQPGLFHLSLYVPTIPRDYFPPPALETQGMKDVWLYSNELDWVTRELGCEVRCVYGAYVAKGFDEGLNRYARFAIEQIRTHRDFKYWLKPTLHCAYGLLAARPVPFETGYFRSKGDTTVSYPMGNLSIIATVHVRDSEIESNIVNVIHRGMIEAEVRKEALRYARFLTEQRQHVLAIYADGIFITDRSRDEDSDNQLRFLQPPWRIKEEVTNLRFHSPTSFTSTQMTRLPGVPRTAKDRYMAQKKLAEEIRKMRDRKPLAKGSLSEA